MKVFVMLFLFILSYNTYANKCTGLKNDLLAVESKLQTSCINTDSGKGCCRPCVEGRCSHQDIVERKACISKHDLMARYNATMAELIIAQGIKSLTLGVVNNYNALNDLTDTHIDKAEERVNKLTSSLEKADLLYWALFANNESEGNIPGQSNQGDVATLFEGYAPQIPIESYVLGRCKRNEYKALKFCKKFKDYKKENAPGYVEFLSTLKGFLGAEHEVGSYNSDNTRMDRFKTYRSKLKLYAGDDPSTGKPQYITPEEFKSSDRYDKVIKLKNKLKELENPNFSAAEKKRIKVQILTRANELDRLHMGYKKLGANVGTQKGETMTFLKTNFDHTLEQLELPSLIMEGDFATHFNNSARRVKADLKRHAKAMLSIAKKSGCSDISCLINKCAPGKDKNGFLNACNQLKFYQEHNNAHQKIEAAQDCLSDKQANRKVEQTLTCLKNKRKSNSSIAKLEKELAELDSIITEQDNTPLARVLNMRKAMGIKALEKHNCIEFNPVVIDGVSSLDCSRKGPLDNSSTELDLGLAGSQISLSLTNNIIQSQLVKLGREDQLKNLTRDFVKSCVEGKQDPGSVCDYYTDQAKWEVDYRQAQARRKAKRREEIRKRKLRNEALDELEEEETSYGAMAAGQFFKSAALYSVPLISLATQTSIMNSERKRAKADIEFQKNLLIGNIERHNEFMANQNFVATNFGPSQLQSNLGAYQSFQADNQQGAFRSTSPTSPFQYRINVPGPVNLNNLIQTTTENRHKTLPNWEFHLFPKNRHQISLLQKTE